jgi:hypothetical protein
MRPQAHRQLLKMGRLYRVVKQLSDLYQGASLDAPPVAEKKMRLQPLW